MLTRDSLLTVLAFLLIMSTLQAQPCPPGPPGGDFCISAPLMSCDLDGYMGSNSGYTPGPILESFCGLIENDQFFKFIVSEVPVAILIFPSNCSRGRGLQAALYDTDDCVNFNAVSACSSLGNVETLTLVTNSVTIGQELHLIIDGFEGDVCDFTIDVIGGVSPGGEVEEDEPKPECNFDLAVGFNFLRRCFSNKVFVQYCNQTSFDEEEFMIEVVLDSYLDVDSTSIPITSQTDSTLLFDIGHLGVDECSEFAIYVTPNCNTAMLGQEHCILAHVYPDKNCEPRSTEWTGADIVVNAVCLGDSTMFVIENIGDAPMKEELNYWISKETSSIISKMKFSLAVGENFTFTSWFSGSTTEVLGFTAEQEPGHPLGNQVSIVSHCTGTSAEFVSELIHEFVDDPSIVAICAKNIGSYDPNDKSATPAGTGPEHFIASGQEVDYKVRFQNTGTDTAFTVVIRDTISSNLDMNTLQEGISSHNYDLEIEEDNILVFTFNNILLPDSTVNWIESNGFVEYSLTPSTSILPDDIIENTASIYFDFNDAIVTNTVFHTIGRPVVYSHADVEVCANNPYNGNYYNVDTTLTELFSGELLDTISVVNITLLPVDSVQEYYTLPFGTLFNDITINSDTIIIDSYTNSFGCDSILIRNFMVENTNSIALLDESNWSIFPNPANDVLSITTNQFFLESNYRVQLVSILGTAVYDQQQNIQSGQTLNLPLQGVAPGTYILYIDSDHGILSQKIIVQP